MKSNYKALTENIDLSQLDLLDLKIKNNSEVLKNIVINIVNSYCEPLDNMMKNINDALRQIEQIPLTNEDLDNMSLQLSSCLYFAGEGVEYIGLKEDVAKAFKMEKFNNAFSQATGTINDKTSAAELNSQEEYIMHSIYECAYKECKHKLEAGNEMLQSIKKVIGRRMTEIQLSRIDPNNRYVGGDI